MTPREELDQIEEQIRKLNERKAEIYDASMAAPEDEKVEIDAFASSLAHFAREDARKTKERLVVRDLVWDEKTSALINTRPNVEFVCVRIAGEADTHLGLYIGEIALSGTARVHKPSEVLVVGMGHHNPAIFVPKLKRIVFGCESWWGAIKSEADLKKITDQDIDNVWYVKALKGLQEKTA